MVRGLQHEFKFLFSTTSEKSFTSYKILPRYILKKNAKKSSLLQKALCTIIVTGATPSDFYSDRVIFGGNQTILFAKVSG